MSRPLGAVIGRYLSSDDSAQLNGGIIRRSRKCRDIAFLVVFIAFWVAMIVNSSFGFNQGNPLRLTYGLDYKGNVCGDKHAHPNLRELELTYWLNPNQVYLSGSKDSQFKLSNARSICLLDCPRPTDDGLNWVCDYPEGDIRISMDDWIDRNYDYYEFLTPEMRNTSLLLQGPCYPVIFPSVNVYWRCEFVAHASNSSLRHWQQMGGVNISEDIIIDKTIHKSINAPSSVLKVAAKVIGEVQALIIFPVIPYVMLAIFYMFWFSAFLHLFSSGQIVQNDCSSNCCAYDLLSKRVNCEQCCGYGIHYTPHIAIAIFFHLFGCYWATQCFIAASATVIAGSVASYYWTRGETSPEIPFLPVFGSMKRLLRYSLGSVALGSLVVSFVESIRVILESIRRKLKGANTVVPDSWVGKVMHHFSRYSLKCIEWTIKSVNRNAYIMIAITGKSFCRSSAMATELIMSNIVRIGKVNVVGDVILLLGKLCVSLSSAVFGFLMLDSHKFKSSHNKISSPLLPVVVCWALGYVVATLFFAVVEMSIDTIILSFCQDSEEHHGTAQYAPPLLMETLNDDQNDTQRLTQ
ncbi:Choline transporter protein 1 [Linum perenne]